MKKLITGGLCLAFGWLTNGASAQELPITWQASPPANVKSSDKAPTPVRPVTLSTPTPIGGTAPPPAVTERPPFAPIVRAQAPDDKAIQPIPQLEIEPKVLQRMPKDKDFTPPPPQTVPSPLFGQLGITPHHDGCDGCNGCNTGCCPSDCCMGGCWDGCCLERPRFWMTAEYLMWWQRAARVPPLVVSSPVGTQPVLGQPSTRILFDSLPDTLRSGGRFGLGMWLCHFDNRLGIEANYFFLNRQSNTAAFSGNGDPLLARPFNDTTPGNTGPNAEVFAGNGNFGSATVTNYTQLWGAEVNVRYKWLCGPTWWLDIIGGYRHLNLSEGIDISESVQTVQDNGARGVHILEQESFHTRNQFNGAQIGLDGEWRFANRWFLGANAKFAFGSVHQIVNIDGSTTFTNVPAPFGNSTQPGALLATPTNMGRFTANRAGFANEVGLKVGVDLTEHVRLFVGYDFIYLNSVVRPGDQIDTNVNQAFRPSIAGPGIGGGPRQPAVVFRTTDYWAQGLNFGLQVRY